MTKTDICNNALDLIGQGSHIQDLETDKTKEGDLCRRLLELTIDRSLAKYNFSFARKDELITNDYLLSDAVSLPYKFTYTLPSDVQRILYLEPYGVSSNNECINSPLQIKFNFRNLNNQRVLVTDSQAPFVMHYQSKLDSVEIFSTSFTEALEYILASHLAPSLIHGTNGVQIGQSLLQQGLMLLSMSADEDAQQGANSIQDTNLPFFIRARRGL